MDTTVKKIGQLLEPYGKISKLKIGRLTAAGENYGSLMLKIDFSTEKQEHHIVAKTIPPNEFLRLIFNSFVTFKNELEFYRKVVPLLQEFQRENKIETVIDFTPKFYGGRLNLRDVGDADEDAVLLLENLKFAGFITLNCTAGVDMETAKIVIKELAKLHGVALALKIKKPEIYEKQVQPYLSTWVLKEETHNNFKEKFSKALDDLPEFLPMKEKLLRAFDRQLVPQKWGNLFTTVTHNDVWINNLLIKLEGDKAAKCKIVDFQTFSEASPARDLLFFLLVNVRPEILQEHYNNLIRYYHAIFLSVLDELNCVTQVFNFPAFEEEIATVARGVEFGHIAFMLFIVFAIKEEVKSIEDLNAENVVPSGEVTPPLKQQLIHFLKFFLENNWV